MLTEFINELWHDQTLIPESTERYVYAFFTGKTNLKYNFSFGFLEDIQQRLLSGFEKDIFTQTEVDSSYKGSIQTMYAFTKERTKYFSILTEKYVPLIKIPESITEKQILLANCYHNYAVFLD